jgi:4-amino-4-deoxy-L-arabinose transferase-like glycosyltransferase
LWLVMALTSLTKGLLGFALPILVIGLHCSLGPGASLVSRNRWLFNRKSLLAVPLGLLVYLLPFLLSHGLAQSAEGLSMVYRENIRRFYDPVNHRGPIWLYAGFIFLLMAPWSPFLPAALVRAHRCCRGSTRENRGERFGLIYFWGLFLFFTLSSSRRGYYLLPILPAGSLLLARLLAEASFSSRLLRAGYVVIAGGSLVSIAALFITSSALLPELPCRVVFLLLWICCALGIVFALLRFSAGRVALSSGLIAAAFMVYLFLFALPGMEGYRTRRRFANEVKQQLGDHPESLALFHNREIVFYLGRPVPLPEYQTAEELAQGLRERKFRWLIARRQDLQELGLVERIILGEESFAWESREQRQHKLVLLNMDR